MNPHSHKSRQCAPLPMATIVVLLPILALTGSSLANAADSKDAKPLTWPGGTRVHGRVVDYQGKPCVDAEVLLLGDEQIVVDGDRRKWFINDRSRHGESLPSTRTDEQGQFRVVSALKWTNRIAVISSEVLLWVVPRKDVAVADDVTIKLPQPGKLTVEVDLPQKPKSIPLYVVLRAFDDSDRDPDVLRFHMSETHVDNPGKRVFDHLPPARYSVEHIAETPIGDRANHITMCERKLATIDSGQQQTVHYEHDVGPPIEGHVKGLEKVQLLGATVTISYWGPEEQRGRNGKRARMLTNFDVISIKSDGKFLTDPIPPGKYELRLFAVRASKSLGRSYSADFDGSVEITIPESGPESAKAQHIEIEATPH